MSKFYLTIDDGPSSYMEQKLQYLNSKNIHAIWFLLGKNLEKNKSVAIDAIRSGHMLGNHSYSHSRFSQMSLEKAREEILRTEALLEEVYATAGIQRPYKLFRFPYGARGFFSHKRKLETLLDEFVFESGPFATTQYKLLYRNNLNDNNWLWSFDVREWAIAKTDFRRTSFKRISNRLNRYLDMFSKDKDQIILMHDHGKTHQHFSDLIEMFLAKGIEFSSYSGKM